MKIAIGCDHAGVAMKNDILPLAYFFMKNICLENKMEEKIFSQNVVRKLLSYDWPGNVRQLFNIVEHCAALCPGRVIGADVVRCALGNVPECSLMVCRTVCVSGESAKRVSIRSTKTVVPEQPPEESAWQTGPTCRQKTLRG